MGSDSAQSMARTKSSQPPKGVAFPLVENARSSTTACKHVLTAAFKAAQTDSGQAVLESLQRNKNWRFGYTPYLVAMATEMGSSQGSNALNIARAGLAAANDLFEYHHHQTQCKMSEAADQHVPQPFFTGIVQGSQRNSPAPEIDVPLDGKSHRGADLVNVVRGIVAHGSAEPSLLATVEEVVQHPEWYDLSGHCVLLLGATSEMGPLEHLLAAGATVIAVARPTTGKKWVQLLNKAKNSRGSLVFPSSAHCEAGDSIESKASKAGADVCAQVPELCQWLAGPEISELINSSACGHLTVYSGIYLDGEGFVRATLAMDAIVQACSAMAHKPCLIYIDTPSAAHVVPLAVKEGSRSTMRESSIWFKWFESIYLLKQNAFMPLGTSSAQRCVYDGLATQQGPNYAMAKLMQRWRAIIARDLGCTVSVTTGPGAKTESVMHAPTLALLMNSLHLFPPNHASDPETVQALLTLVMMRDLQSKKAYANPDLKLENPMDLFFENAWHGGAWRSPYDLKSIGHYVVARHYLLRFVLPLCFVMLIAYTYYFA